MKTQLTLTTDVQHKRLVISLTNTIDGMSMSDTVSFNCRSFSRLFSNHSARVRTIDLALVNGYLADMPESFLSVLFSIYRDVKNLSREPLNVDINTSMSFIRKRWERLLAKYSKELGVPDSNMELRDAMWIQHVIGVLLIPVCQFIKDVERENLAETNSSIWDILYPMYTSVPKPVHALTNAKFLELAAVNIPSITNGEVGKELVLNFYSRMIVNVEWTNKSLDGVLRLLAYMIRKYANKGVEEKTYKRPRLQYDNGIFAQCMTYGEYITFGHLVPSDYTPNVGDVYLGVGQDSMVKIVLILTCNNKDDITAGYSVERLKIIETDATSYYKYVKPSHKAFCNFIAGTDAIDNDKLVNDRTAVPGEYSHVVVSQLIELIP